MEFASLFILVMFSDGYSFDFKLKIKSSSGEGDGVMYGEARLSHTENINWQK